MIFPHKCDIISFMLMDCRLTFCGQHMKSARIEATREEESVMVKENCKKTAQRAGSILVGMLLLLGMLMGCNLGNASASAENSGGGCF